MQLIGTLYEELFWSHKTSQILLKSIQIFYMEIWFCRRIAFIILKFYEYLNTLLK